MRSGNRWLIAGLAGVTLALPSIPCAAQGNAGRATTGSGAARSTPGDATTGGRTGGTTAPSTATGAAQQGSFQAPAPIRPGQTVSVLAFPFGFTADSDTAAKPTAPGSAVAGVPDAAATGLTADQQRMSEYLTGIVKAGFLATPAYTVMTYHPQSSLVARAVKDGVLTNAQTLDVVAPATGAVDVDRARVLTNRLGIQAFLVGTMEVKTPPKSNTVEITLETQLISSATGEVLRSAAVSGAAAGAEGVPLQTVQERAALETAQKVLPAMGIQLQAPRAAEAPATSKGKAKASKSKASTQPKREQKTAATKSASSKDERKAAEEARKQEEAARKQQERQAEAARKEQARAEEKAREAQKEAKKAAEKAEREAKRQAEKSRDQDKHAASSKKESVKPAVQTDNTAAAPHPSTIQTAQAAPAAPAPAPAATAAPAGTSASAIPNSVTARADASGYPVPYGYAVDATSPKLPSRDRTHLRVPAWLGVAGFLTGISFLL